jgi:methionyl-tRNA formyltransferase
MSETNGQLKIVLLTTKTPEDIWLINQVAEVCRIEGIVLPVKSRYGQFGLVPVFKKRIRQFGILAVANQALLVLYRLIFERGRDKKTLKSIFTGKSYRYIERKDVDILEVEDINSEEVANLILSKAPDLVVVSGTPLLKKHIISATRGKIINLHPGMAPQYRGRYGMFWPIYNREPELVGETVHFLDEGIDTGPILLQRRIDFDPDDTLKTITYKQHRTGVALLIECLTHFDVMASKAYHHTNCVSNNYYVPGIIQYLKARRWLRQQKNKLIRKTILNHEPYRKENGNEI